MTSRVKEDERSEKIIRGLLKLPENRRCINCNNLGPQYVCTTFLTFVCTNCSGFHREFTHRVKSVSMSKFTAEEVIALQAGGNERARQIYFKGWDPQLHSFPDGSNLHRLRDFIKHVYVDRKYTGERSTDKLPSLKLSDKEDSNKKVDIYERRYSERSSSGGRNEDRSFKYYYDERRSPRYAQENNRYGGYKRSPVCFEVVDDRFRDDGFGSGRKSDSRRFANVESMPGNSSPNSKKNTDRSKSPVVRPVRDILGENMPPLQVGELPIANDRRDADCSAPYLEIAPSSNVKSTEGNPVEHKIVNSGGLIYFNTNPEPPDAAPVPQAQTVPPSIDAGNWSGVGSSAKEMTSHPPKENTLESLLSQLIVPPPVPSGDMHEVFNSGSVPSTAPVGNMLMVPTGGISPAAYIGGMSAFPQGVGMPTTNPSSNLLMPNEGALIDASTAQPTNVTMSPPRGSAAAASATSPSTNFPMEPPNGSAPSAPYTANLSSNAPMSPLIGGDPVTATSGIMPASPNSGEDNTLQVTTARLPSMQQNQPSALSAVGISSTAQQASPSIGALDDQLWASSLASNADGPATASAEQSSQDVSKSTQDTSSGGGLQSMEVKSSRRKELPLDLFTASYSAVPAPVPHWQSSQHHGMGFGMQYHPAALPMPAFPNQTTSANPFLNSGTAQAPMFPSMASMQEALSNVSAPTGSLHTSSLGTQSAQLMLAPSPSYPSTMPPRSPSYASTVSPRVYMEQQALSNMSPSGIQGFGSFESGAASLSTNQHSTGRYTGPTNPNSFLSGGGNPFG